MISMTIPDRPKSLGPNGILALAGFAGLSLAGARRLPAPFDARSSTRHLSRHGRRFLSRRVRAGLLSFISPCVLPLAAPYLSFSRGRIRRSARRRERDQGQARHSHHRRFIRGGLLDGVRRPRRDGLRLGGGAQAMEPCFINRGRDRRDPDGAPLSRSIQNRRDAAREAARDREAGGLVERLSDGLRLRARPPCIGPILATILAVAGSRDTVASGAALLAVYSLGLGLPFIAAAAAIGPFIRASRHLRAQFGRIEKLSASCSSRRASHF